MNKQPNTNSGLGVRLANENNIKIMALKVYEKMMQNIQSEGIYGFADNDKEKYEFGKGYDVLTDEDQYGIDELNKLFFFPTPKMVHKKSIDVAPIHIEKLCTIGRVLLDNPLLRLLDTGNANTMILSRALPRGCNPIQSE